MPLAECALGPLVDAAFLRKSRREFRDDEALRHEEEEPGEHPQRQRAWSRLRRRREPPQPNHGNEVEQHQVSESERPLQRRFVPVAVDRHPGFRHHHSTVK